jgi:hypothetical protein
MKDRPSTTIGDYEPGEPGRNIMNVENVSREDWALAGVALLLLITLLALPWFSYSFGPFSISATATDGPDGWLGILAVLALVALIADLGVERLAPEATVPSIGGSRTQTRFVLAAVAAGLVALKFLFHIHFSLFGWGFYAAVALTAALVWAANQARSSASAVGHGVQTER